MEYEFPSRTDFPKTVRPWRPAPELKMAITLDFSTLALVAAGAAQSRIGIAPPGG